MALFTRETEGFPRGARLASEGKRRSNLPQSRAEIPAARELTASKYVDVDRDSLETKSGCTLVGHCALSHPIWCTH